MWIFCSYVNSGSNLVLLCWSCVLARHVYSKTELCKDAQWIRLVQVQCLALHGVLSAGTACVCEAGKKKLYRVWREVQYWKLACDSQIDYVFLCLIILDATLKVTGQGLEHNLIEKRWCQIPLFYPFTLKIWLLILPSSCYTPPC